MKIQSCLLLTLAFAIMVAQAQFLEDVQEADFDYHARLL